ncbi:chemotaxis protein CheA [Candidatus Phycosocius bacilliformis]|uniref:Chemotaxis protein CheA n=1 Tax=Candidatus Phycosocius bacilliformis TaxID=1445552 RepID=A0A2P2E5Q8_9PROT|nr:chemotaxis protein CheA [Candidatus Phycosocius bacilliformis]GBF56390.1 chemotaxis protein CheA [Candidatus Phycosocius bacilliformis]
MSADDPFEAIKQTFFLECEELLTDLEASVTALTFGDGDGETINAAFRAIHSIKGGAGAFGLEDLVRFAHVFETFMDELRSGRKACDDTAIRAMLHASDVLADHVSFARGLIPSMDEERSATVANDLRALMNGAGPAPLPAAAPEPSAPAGTTDEIEAAFGFKPVMFNLDALPEDAAMVPEGWTISFKPHVRLYETGNEPALLLRELARLGPCTVTLHAEALAPFADLHETAAGLSWTIELDAPVEKTAIQEIFEFVEDECDLVIAPKGGALDTPDVGDVDIAALLAAATAPASDPVVPAAADVDIQALLAAAQAPLVPPIQSAGEAPTTAPQTPTKAPAATAAAAPATSAGTQASIRVDLDRIDKLINVVGELVIQQAMLAQSVAECGLTASSTVKVGLEDLEQLSREIQDSVMAIRAQPVKSVFQRMPRLVREVAEMTGKQVRLVTEGEATEVDKTVVDRLAEPITHMIRNAIDHGLEDSEGRAAAGKPKEGTIRLAALHRSGRIVIEVSDDGRGINRERVRKIAIDRGLIAADANLTNEETDNLIFLPGFSTADTVSDISGRGVGMDVVRRSIQQLGGRISIASTPGKGSVFTMSLPLTLAVLDGMVVRAGGQTLLSPLPSIIESFTPREGDLHRIGARDWVIRFRDRFLPLIDTAKVLGFSPPDRGEINGKDGIAIVVENEGGSQVALWVDDIQGQRQVVIKSLETNYRKVEGISAATILGDGRVALILDIDALVVLGRQQANHADFKIAS